MSLEVCLLSDVASMFSLKQCLCVCFRPAGPRCNPLSSQIKAGIILSDCCLGARGPSCYCCFPSLPWSHTSRELLNLLCDLVPLVACHEINISPVFSRLFADPDTQTAVGSWIRCCTETNGCEQKTFSS